MIDTAARTAEHRAPKGRRAPPRWGDPGEPGGKNGATSIDAAGGRGLAAAPPEHHGDDLPHGPRHVQRWVSGGVAG